MTKSIGENILEKIKKKGVKMKPRSYFVFKTALFILGIVLALVFLVFLISFIIFTLRIKGILYFPAFGFRGLGIFLASFPWLLLLLAIAFILVLEIFARRFSIVYRKPLFYSALGIAVISLLLGLIIAQTPMHKRLFRGAQEGGLPVFGPLYKGRHISPPENVYFGKVLSVADDGFEIETKEGKSFSVVISPESHFPFAEDIKEGDMVMVIGDKDDSTIKALGARKITDRDSIEFYRRRPMRNRPQ